MKKTEETTKAKRERKSAKGEVAGNCEPDGYISGVN